MKDTEKYIEGLCRGASEAAPALANSDTAKRNSVISGIADRLLKSKELILTENKKDVDSAGVNGVPPTMIDRLTLNEARIDAMAAAMQKLVALPDVLGGGERWVRPNGLEITRVRVPLGVCAIIFESRPNVALDAATLCIKTGNAVILRGGKEAINSNRCLVGLIKDALCDGGFSGDAVQLVDDITREGTACLMQMRKYVDVLIPRGGKGLIAAVCENAKIPVIETGAGNCHMYIDESAEFDMAVKLAVSAKISRPSVCNSIETLLVHRDVAERFLPRFFAAAEKNGVTLRGCEETRKILPAVAPATEEDYYTEYNDYILAVRIVDDVRSAVRHINKYGTHHSETIVTRDLENAGIFKRETDSAAVYVNASTRFTDGEEYGFGAEIGISTQKLHARGPMGPEALTTVKYLIDGNGQTR